VKQKPKPKSRTKALRLKTDSGTVHELKVRAGVPAIAGRSEADLRIEVRSVSRQHCRFEVNGDGDLEVVDLGSQNGTYLNGSRVTRATLKTGDRLVLGKVPLAVEVEDLDLGSARKRDVERTAPERPVVAPPSGRLGAPRPEAGPVATAAAAAAPAPAAPAPKPVVRAPTEPMVRARLEELGFEALARVERSDRVLAYRGRRRDLGQDVLIKAVLVTDYERAERLLREARLAAKVRHRNVVSTYDVREVPGLVAIVLEHVEGRTLADEIAALGSIAVPRALLIGIEVCGALVQAHAAGVIHRNITPRSVVLAADGGIKLIDFGLAKSLIGGSRSKLTRSGQGLGEPRYAPPEQQRDASTTDGRADIYGLGATLYHALGGSPPRAAEGDDAARPPPLPPGVPDPARAVVARCLRPDREARYQTADELLHALEGALALVDPDGAATGRRLAAVTGRRTGIFGRVEADELAQLLQGVELSGKGGYLEVYGGEREGGGGTVAGTIVLRKGKVIDARSDDARGREAVLDLLLLRKGTFSLIYGDPPAAPGEGAPLAVSSLLFEAARRRDEAGTAW